MLLTILSYLAYGAAGSIVLFVLICAVIWFMIPDRQR